jgi:ABC-type oligopeptide transport system substrate-binding subunit
MNFKKSISFAFALVIIASLLLTACGGGEPEAAEEEAAPVLSYGYSTTDIPTLDPQVGEDVVSINWIENIFVHLTNYDLVTSEVVPEAATEWDVSADGLTYTFTIRTDIPWVYHVPGGETTQVTDEEGNPRFLVAGDFEYGMKRLAIPTLALTTVVSLPRTLLAVKTCCTTKTPMLFPRNWLLLSAFPLLMRAHW